MDTKPLPNDAMLIVNAHSRRGQDNFAEAREKLEAAGIRLIAAHAVEDPEKMAATVAAAVAGGAPMVIVGGGDGRTERRMWSTEVRILNGPFLGGVELSDQADVDTGEIVIQAVVGRSKPRLAWDWYAKFFKLRDRHAHTEEFRGRSFKIDTTPRQKIALDGEPLAKTPVTVRVAPGAIEVAAPAES